jgi:hypothetical protein
VRTLAAAALALALPRAACACAVCFGGVDGQKGFFMGLGWAILTMLAVTLSLIGGIGYALYSIERARAEHEA